MKKRKLNIKKVINFIFILIVIVVSIFFIKKLFTRPGERLAEPKVIGEINGYELKEGATSYYKNIFNDLKEELSKDELDEENYAKIISKLFISDCFNLNNKISNNDVGGVQFVYEPFRDDFILIAKETLYSSVENNVYGNRKQDLPVVSKVEITDIQNDNYEYLETEDNNAYFIKASIKYSKDLGYPEEVSLIIIHNNDKLEISEMD